MDEIPETLELDDARAIRALAHPIRLAILDLIRSAETATATECGHVTGESPQTCSYHLRALAKRGFVTRAPSDDGRETRWGPAARTIVFTGSVDSPEGRAVASLLQTSVLDRDRRLVVDFLEHADELSDEWQDAASFTRSTVHATAEELVELARQVHELVGRYRRPSESDRPDGARPVDLVLYAIPKVGDR
ncbi:MAG TPA: helix-turn-helix domain-containing protein [Gaiellaceae bacterium]|jgi:DNA-binding transcriptional ArsR family regulator|nr:helix-turn-helix domain-containing protein [Gaiellaceae bacterium]